MKEKISRYFFQAAIGIVLGYFGFLALANPQLEAAKWVSQYSADLIELVMPVVIFLYIFGAIQITVAVLLVIDKFTKTALLTASVILLAVIINLGWNEIALRDFAILAGTVHLYFSLSKDKI